MSTAKKQKQKKKSEDNHRQVLHLQGAIRLAKQPLNTPQERIQTASTWFSFTPCFKKVPECEPPNRTSVQKASVSVWAEGADGC